MPESRTPDDYERQYMDADRAVLIARVRQHPKLPLVVGVFLAVIVAFTVQQLVFIVPWLWALRHQAPLAVALISAVYALCAVQVLSLPIIALIGAITRVVLTPTHLRVHRGLVTTDIPLEAVTAVAVERTARWFPQLPAFSGMLRRDVVYQSFRTKESLRVEWRDAKGRAKRLWVYLDEAEALRERIAAQRGGETGVRVDATAADATTVSDDPAARTAPPQRAGRR